MFSFLDLETMSSQLLLFVVLLSVELVWLFLQSFLQMYNEKREKGLPRVFFMKIVNAKAHYILSRKTYLPTDT